MSDLLLTTRRLVLRPLRESDARAFAQLEEDPTVQQFMFMGRRPSVSQSREALVRFCESFDADGFGVLAVEYDGEFSGYCGLLRSDIDDGADVELICAIHPKLRRSGLAVEASRRVLRWVFEDLPIPRVLAKVSDSNKAGLKLALRLGMAPYKVRVDPMTGESQQVFEATSSETTRRVPGADAVT